MSRPADRQQSYVMRGYHGRAHVHFGARYREVCWWNRWTHETGSKVIQGGHAFADYAAYCAARRLVDGGEQPSYAHLPCDHCRTLTDELFLAPANTPLVGLVCPGCKQDVFEACP